jgi:phenylacetate-CoA ligase
LPIAAINPLDENGLLSGTMIMWRRVPVIDALTVRREASRLCCVPQRRLDSVTTVGSSGHPLPFFLDRDRSLKEYAFVMDLRDRAGCGPDDWRALFRGWHIPAEARLPFEVEPALRQRLSVFSMEPDHMARYAREIAQRDIRFLQGYPYALVKFANFLVSSDLPLPIASKASSCIPSRSTLNIALR